MNNGNNGQPIALCYIDTCLLNAMVTVSKIDKVSHEGDKDQMPLEFIAVM